MEIDQVKQIKLRTFWNKALLGNKYKYRIMWGIILFEFVLLVGQVIYTNYQLSKPAYRPYVVEVKDGQIDFRGVVQEQELTVNDAIIRNYLRQFKLFLLHILYLLL